MLHHPLSSHLLCLSTKRSTETGCSETPVGREVTLRLHLLNKLCELIFHYRLS